MRLNRLAAGDLAKRPRDADRRGEGRRLPFPARAPSSSKGATVRPRPPGLFCLGAGRLAAKATRRSSSTAARLTRRLPRSASSSEGPQRRARAAAIYDEPPGRAEIETLSDRGRPVATFPRDAMGDLEALARSLQPGDFRQTIGETRPSYKRGDPAPVSPVRYRPGWPPLIIEPSLTTFLHATAESEQGADRPNPIAPLGAGGDASLLSASPRPPFPRAPRRGLHPNAPRRGLQAQRPPSSSPRPRPDAATGAALGHAAARYALSLLVDTDSDLALVAKAWAPQMQPLMENELDPGSYSDSGRREALEWAITVIGKSLKYSAAVACSRRLE